MGVGSVGTRAFIVLLQGRDQENNFDRAVKAVPDDATLTQAAASLRDEAANVQAAVSDLRTAAKC